ncbi:diguanylate cyclase [candidate division WWE3 bacterium]|nr:diguanylate cyclase [candidate division WWE3 bacterium]
MVLEVNSNDETYKIEESRVPSYVNDNYQADTRREELIADLRLLGLRAGIGNMELTIEDDFYDSDAEDATQANKAINKPNLEKPNIEIQRNDPSSVIQFVAKALELEAFIREYDITGAKTELEYETAKGEISHDLEFDIDENTKTIRLKNPEIGKKTFTSISLSNFASLNTYVSHTSGDRALREIVKGVYGGLEQNGIPESQYGFYRTGADFVLLSNDSELTGKLRVRTNGKLEKVDSKLSVGELAKIHVEETTSNEAIKVSPEVVVTSVSLQDAIDIYNQAIQSLTPKQLEDFVSPNDLKRIVLQLAINSLNMQKEFSQMCTTADNLLKYLKSEKVDEVWAKNYYDQFIHKNLLSFNGGEYADWNKFVTLSIDQLHEIFLQESRRKVFSQVASIGDFEQNLRDLTVRKAISQSGVVANASVHLSQTESIASILPNHPSEKLLDPEEFALKHETKKQKNQREFKTDLDRLNVLISDKSKSLEDSKDEIMRLLTSLDDKAKHFRYNIPKFINIATLTSTSPRKVSIERIIEDATLELNDSTKPEETRVQGVKSLSDMYRNIYRIEKHSHDSLTGLLNKREFYARAETGLARALLENSPLTLVFGDINDLNLANRGGRKFGDAQLQLVGSSIEAVLTEQEDAGKYGGDELALLVAGGTKRGIEVIKGISQAISEERIPKHAEAIPDFEAFNPNIGWGYIDLLAAQHIFNDLINQAFVDGVPLPNGGPISSREDSIRLKFIVDKFEAGALNTIIPENEDYRFYVKELLQMALKYVDIQVDADKAARKFQRLYDMLYVSDPENNLPPFVGQDEEISVEELKQRLESSPHGRWTLMRISAASKSLKNATLEIFEKARKMVGKGEHAFTTEEVDSLINTNFVASNPNNNQSQSFLTQLLEDYASERVAGKKSKVI